MDNHKYIKFKQTGGMNINFDDNQIKTLIEQ